VNFGGGSSGEHGAVSTGSDDVLRVVQTLMAAQIVGGSGFGQQNKPAQPALPNNGVTPPVRRGS